MLEFYPRLNKDRSPWNSHTFVQIIQDLTSTNTNRPDVNLPAQEYYGYIGWGPLAALALLPLAAWKHPKKRAILFFGTMLIITILMVDQGQMPWNELVANTPFLAQFHLPTRWLIFCSLAVIVLSGFSVDTLWKLAGSILADGSARFKNVITAASRAVLAAFTVFAVYGVFNANARFLRTVEPLLPLDHIMAWLRESDNGVYYVDLYKDFPMAALSNNLWILYPWYHFTQPSKGNPSPRPLDVLPNYLLIGTTDPIYYPDPVNIKTEGVYSIFKLPHSLPFSFVVSDDAFYDQSLRGLLTVEEITPVAAQLKSS